MLNIERIKLIIIGLVTAALLSAPACVRANLRNAKIGDRLVGFEFPTHGGSQFKYDPAGGRVIALVFLPAMDEQFATTVDAIEKVLDRAKAEKSQFDVVGIASGQSAVKTLDTPKASDITFPVVLDLQYKLWGKLGVIATPTTVLAGKDGRIQWIQAGYGYDFIPALEGRIYQALGMEKKEDPNEHTKVKIVENNTPESKIERHIRMARMLEGKGMIDAAVAELKTAMEVDPNNLEPRLELGQMYCRTGKPDEALRLAGSTEATKRTDKAKVMLIAGWASRLKKQMQEAEKFLLEAARLDPMEARAHFELGKLYQETGRKDEALAAYYRALTIVFKEAPESDISQK